MLFSTQTNKSENGYDQDNKPYDRTGKRTMRYACSYKNSCGAVRTTNYTDRMGNTIKTFGKKPGQKRFPGQDKGRQNGCSKT